MVQGLNVLGSMRWTAASNDTNTLQIVDLAAGEATLIASDARTSERFDCQANAIGASATDFVDLEVTRKCKHVWSGLLKISMFCNMYCIFIARKRSWNLTIHPPTATVNFGQTIDFVAELINSDPIVNPVITHWSLGDDSPLPDSFIVTGTINEILRVLSNTSVTVKVYAKDQFGKELTATAVLRVFSKSESNDQAD